MIGIVSKYIYIASHIVERATEMDLMTQQLDITRSIYVYIYAEH